MTDGIQSKRSYLFGNRDRTVSRNCSNDDCYSYREGKVHLSRDYVATQTNRNREATSARWFGTGPAVIRDCSYDDQPWNDHCRLDIAQGRKNKLASKTVVH